MPGQESQDCTIWPYSWIPYVFCPLIPPTSCDWVSAEDLSRSQKFDNRTICGRHYCMWLLGTVFCLDFSPRRFRLRRSKLVCNGFRSIEVAPCHQICLLLWEWSSRSGRTISLPPSPNSWIGIRISVSHPNISIRLPSPANRNTIQHWVKIDFVVFTKEHATLS